MLIDLNCITPCGWWILCWMVPFWNIPMQVQTDNFILHTQWQQCTPLAPGVTVWTLWPRTFPSFPDCLHLCHGVMPSVYLASRGFRWKTLQGV